MLRESFHNHTWRCNHAENTEREYVENAVSGGMTKLGFSDHAPYVFENGYYSGFRMRPEEAEGYFASIQALKQEFAGQIARVKNLVRPANYPPSAPGSGWCVVNAPVCRFVV